MAVAFQETSRGRCCCRPRLGTNSFVPAHVRVRFCSQKHSSHQVSMGNKPWSNFCVAPAAFEPLAHTSPARLVTVGGTATRWAFGVSKDVVSRAGNRNSNPNSCNRGGPPASVMSDPLLASGNFPGLFPRAYKDVRGGFLFFWGEKKPKPQPPLVFKAYPKPFPFADPQHRITNRIRCLLLAQLDATSSQEGR